MLDHGDLLRATVAEVVAVDRADQPLWPLTPPALRDTGTVDDEVAVAVNVGRSVDGVEQHRCGVVAVTPEGSRRARTMGGLVVGEHLLSGLAGRLVGVGTEADVRTREVEALGRAAP